MAAPLLRIRGLRVDYPGLVAVAGLDLELHAGEALALIGPNGAGKTSTMRAIAGLVEPTTGRVEIDGYRRETAREEVSRRLGFMPDIAPLYDKLTVREFLEHYGRAYQVPDLDARIAHCLVMTELDGKIDASCGSLSRGMKQRLVLARCLLPDPKVLLLDEPASGLDPVSRRGFRQLIRLLRDQGKALVVSSHILGEIDEFCTHALVLERGAVRMFGRIDQLVSATGVRARRLAWRAGDERALDVLAAHPSVRDVTPEHQGATFGWVGDDAGLDALLVALVQSGIRVAEWSAADNNLEHILLHSGARELQ